MYGTYETNQKTNINLAQVNEISKYNIIIHVPKQKNEKREILNRV